MDFKQAIISGFQNYVNFQGRALRSEYWYWILFAFLVALASSIIDAVIFGAGANGPLYIITSLALFLPGLAVSIRRLHDVDRSGWWILIAFTIIGIIPLIYWDCIAGTPGPNRFGAPRQV